MLNWTVQIELIICIKMDLTLNNLQRLICYKPKQPTHQPNLHADVSLILVVTDYMEMYRHNPFKRGNNNHNQFCLTHKSFLSVKPLPKSVLAVTLNWFWLWGSSPGALGEYGVPVHWYHSQDLIGWGCRINRLLLCRGVKLPQAVSWIWHEAIGWWDSSNAEALGKAEYSFIAFAPRSTLARSGSTW